MFAGTLLQVLQTSFLSSCLSFPSSIMAADGRQLEDFAYSPLVWLKRGFCWWNIMLAAPSASSSGRRSLSSPESPPRKAFIITLILRGPFTTC